MVDHNRTIFRYQLAEAMEGMDDIINILKEVQMVCVYIQDDGNRRMETQEGVGVLTGFRNKAVMCTDAQGTADRRQVAAYHNSGIHAALHTDQGQHGRGCGLAMGTGDTDRIAIGNHDGAPGLGTFQYRNPQLPCTGNFRVIIMYGSGADDQIRTLYIFGKMCICNFCAERNQLVRYIRLGTVRAGHLCTQVQQQLCQRGHRNTTDANKMNGFVICYIRL